VGSEGTCAVTLEATLRLVPSPPARALLVAGFTDVFAAADAVPGILDRGEGIVGLEGLDSELVEDQRKGGTRPDDLELLPDGSGWLLIELGGDDRDQAAERARRLAAAIEKAAGGALRSAAVLDDPRDQKRLWEVRESGLGATARVPGEAETWEGWEDSAVPPERLGGYLRDFRALLDGYGYHGAAFYGHFGQGCVHTRIPFDLRTPGGVADFRAFVGEAADLVVRYGGSLSGEHGDGQSRAELLPKLYGDELCRAFAEFKRIWDPEGGMNPGKVAHPYPIVSNLRLGAAYRPWEPETAFGFPADGGRLSEAALRCVGVGKCRRETGGTMCPSWRVTHDEKHSTRGRAHLLFEMLRGEVIEDGWRSEEVKEALDLCLACKGCKGDCPVQVDIATYKAEFLHHYYRRRLRPRAAYSMGLIRRWAGIASHLPRTVNLLARTPGLARLIKAAGGIAPERRMPRFATRTFRRRFAGRDQREGRDVLLWPDTFNDYFHPEIAEAAVEVLEAAGCRVRLPPAGLCCGRPLYDYGFLDLARRRLAAILQALEPEIVAGTPIVGLVPSCVATFRDELPAMLPGDENARRLAAQVVTLGEYLGGLGDDGDGDDDGWRPPRLAGRAVVHGHCHHKAVMGLEPEVELLRATGLEVEVLDSGCCGMAGSFGFEVGKYQVSMACGELVLLPAVRAAAPDTLLVADGFSCREQIHQATGRRALHTAEVLAGGL
jgi:Fe-S oxidoreductase